jgi:hypothetical protein
MVSKLKHVEIGVTIYTQNAPYLLTYLLTSFHRFSPFIYAYVAYYLLYVQFFRHIPSE